MSWTQNLCRTCGQIAETCHNIYNSDMNKSLESKIKGCLQLQIKLDDLKPKQICNNCLMKLNELSDFLHTAQKTDTKFDTIYYSTYKRIGDAMEEIEEPSNAILATNKETSTRVAEFDNETALVTKDNQVFRSPSGDFFQSTKTNLRSFRSACQLNAERLKGRIKRIQRVYDFQNETGFKAVKSNPDNSYKKYMISYETVRNSLKLSSRNLPDSINNDNFICTKCNRGFVNEENLKAHMAFNHEPNRAVVSRTLNVFKMQPKKRPRGLAKFKLSKKLMKQRKRKERSKKRFSLGPIKCPLCHKFFKNRTALKHHEKFHIQQMLKSSLFKKKLMKLKTPPPPPPEHTANQ